MFRFCAAIPELVELVPRFELSALDLMPDDLERFDDNFEHLSELKAAAAAVLFIFRFSAALSHPRRRLAEG